jgi:hypothetical protein
VLLHLRRITVRRRVHLHQAPLDAPGEGARLDTVVAAAFEQPSPFSTQVQRLDLFRRLAHQGPRDVRELLLALALWSLRRAAPDHRGNPRPDSAAGAKKPGLVSPENLPELQKLGFLVSELREAFQLALTVMSSTEVQQIRWRCGHVFRSSTELQPSGCACSRLGRVVWRSAVWGAAGGNVGRRPSRA